MNVEQRGSNDADGLRANDPHRTVGTLAEFRQVVAQKIFMSRLVLIVGYQRFATRTVLYRIGHNAHCSPFRP